MIYNERGLCQYKMVCFDEAVEDFTNAVRLNPSLGAAYYSRATINYRLLAGYPHGSSEREGGYWHAEKAVCSPLLQVCKKNQAIVYPPALPFSLTSYIYNGRGNTLTNLLAYASSRPESCG